MKNNKAISMISLIVTIILMIILAAISSRYLSTIIDDAQYKDAKEEFKNVENIVEYAKTQILIDEFMPDESLKITDTELNSKFGKVLSAEEIEYIRQVNAASDIKAPYKFYLMNQTRFDSEFGNDYNVSNLREAREYLVNYMDTIVVCSYDGERIASSEDITPSVNIARAEIDIGFTPNGNMEWAKQQSTMVSVTSNAAAEIVESKYLWSQSYTEPNLSEFISNISNGQTVNLSGKTGNDWYLWIYIAYREKEEEKTYLIRSNPFYVDNIAPSAELEVEEISR